MFSSNAAGRAGLVLLSLLILASNLPAGTQGSATSEADKAWKILEGATTESDPANRMQGIAALATIGPQPRVVNLLVARLDDKEADVRRLAAEKLGEIKAQSAVPRLKSALSDPDPDVGFTAAQSLWQMGDQSGRGLLLRVLAHKQAGSTGLVKGAVQEAEEKLHEPMGLVLMGAEQAAGYFFGPASFGIAIAEELKIDRSLPARAVAASLLGTDSDPNALEALKAALSDGEWVIRAAAARALGNSNVQVVPLLVPLLNDSRKPVRYMAAASIVRLSLR
jgi:HEAT repeat protein